MVWFIIAIILLLIGVGLIAVVREHESDQRHPVMGEPIQHAPDSKENIMNDATYTTPAGSGGGVMDVEFCPAEDVERAALMELDRMGAFDFDPVNEVIDIVSAAMGLALSILRLLDVWPRQTRIVILVAIAVFLLVFAAVPDERDPTERHPRFLGALSLVLCATTAV